jgi:hypothetical protein
MFPTPGIAVKLFHIQIGGAITTNAKHIVNGDYYDSFPSDQGGLVWLFAFEDSHSQRRIAFVVVVPVCLLPIKF